ncbi:UDP-N-acetylglucosamine 1-carboxyvinyltransferase [Mucisphaera calidilacus]|uniref:UDP-N-acetylglucosamine 1-carboxyvinyltransferase n=1 Tax=Mucisphaera calidilacus TaxID=2527982 RepID=A0A518C102_9BACT|nr:UDP-N-acetylglucosamine 1-carboxyvinyltransferase [Mucisphaera calidilacus]QDU72899.1 UDP-N-acetylglucosamine 1-carboxyvinyltransferase MurA [Mucisphaera calidilacus]
MDAFVIEGGRPLRGSVRVNGSKNASLPLMAAALLTDEPVTLHDVPRLSDIGNMVRLLEALGCTVERPENAGRLSLHVTDDTRVEAHYDIVRTMRAGICVLGPLLARRGRARVSMPGGCAIGDRPVDLHLRGLRALGAEIHLEGGYIVATSPANGTERLRGRSVFLGGPNGSTVLGTANVMSAAALAEGVTVIESAACEPEVEDLAGMLNGMGAKITGAGTPRITIEGVERLSSVDHTVMPDRIEAGTYVIASAITNGDIELENYPGQTLLALHDRLEQVGVEVTPDEAGDGWRQRVRISTRRRLEPVHVVTQPHPGFPTDLQAQLMALLCLADGNSMVTEKIFPDRFLHVAELLRMGANLTRTGPSVLVSGVGELVGAPVMASDLRASAGLVLAGLAARGTTIIRRVYHLDRGYERMERTLQELGATIERVDQETLA